MNILKGLVLLIIFSTIQLRADDLLLDTLQGKAAEPEKPAQAGTPIQAGTQRIQRMTVDLAKLTDPFQKHMYAQFEMADQISYDLQQWANQILLGNYIPASHLWSVIEPQVPQKLQNISIAANLYTLWKMGLNQTFFNRWIKTLNNADYMGSNAEVNLEAALIPSFDQWLIDNALVLNPAQEAAILNMPTKSPLAVSLKSWALLRKGEKAEGILGNISPTSPLRIYLAETVALAHARKNDLVGVARVLKNHLQPIIEKQHDPKILSLYYMTIGRLLFQAGNLTAAKEYYEKVPNSSSQFLQAREELAWVLLRQGNISQLRGEMKTLGSPLFDGIFAPDVYVVRSITNLKMCFYNAVDKDFEKFGENNRSWATKIDQAINATAAPAPGQLDTFSKFSVDALNKLTVEKNRLEQLGRDSITATLPAVGIQKHWKEALDEIVAAYEIEKKNQDMEFRRQWKNQKSILAEAIKKMRFVKVEYLTQIRQLSEGKIDRATLVADQGKVVPGSSVKTDSNQIVFPLDTHPWPDELFRLRSTAQSRCTLHGGTK